MRHIVLSFKILYNLTCAVLVVFVAAGDSNSSITNNVGTTAFSSIKIGIGAKAIGMGGAFSAIADDATASYWNPAGLSQIRGSQLSTMHLEWFRGMRYEFIGYAHCVKDIGTFEISSSMLTSGEMPKIGSDNPYDKIGTFSAIDFVSTFSYAKSIKEELNLETDLAIGANFKILYQKIDIHSTWGSAIDVGVLCGVPTSALKRLERIVDQSLRLKLGLSKVTFAIIGRNLGPKVMYKSRTYALPFKINLGYAAKFLANAAAVAADVNIPNDSRVNCNVGGEYWVTKDFAIRIGYKTGSSLGKLSGLRIGMGTKFKPLKLDLKLLHCKSLELDYAFAPSSDLGRTHWFSIIIDFGRYPSGSGAK